MHDDASLPDMLKAYETAALWRPERRTDLLGDVVAHVFADASTNSGYAAIHDWGHERLVRFDIHSGAITDALSEPDLVSPPNFRSPNSPDGKHRVELRDFNLWLINKGNGVETQLTTDGSADYPYGQGRQAKPYDQYMKRPMFLWSSDGRYVVTQRLDLHGVNVVPLTEAAPRDGGLPKAHDFIDAFPGHERVPHIELLIIDTVDGSIKPVDLDPVAATHTSPLMRRDLWWNDSSSKIYFVHSTRDWLQLSLLEIDPSDGSVRSLVHEEHDKRIRPNVMFHQLPCVAVNSGIDGASEAIWFSERDGWGHL